jgi:hypothetical protein
MDCNVKNPLPVLPKVEEPQVEAPKELPKTEEVFQVEKVEEPKEVVEVKQEPQEVIQEVIQEKPKKEKKKRVASDKLREHLAKARAKSLETRRRNKELKQQKLAEANEQIKQSKTKSKPIDIPQPTQAPQPKQSTNFEIDYDRIINGLSQKLVNDYELNTPAPIQKPEPPLPQQTRPIPRQIPRQPNIQEIRQQERNEAQKYYSALYEQRNQKKVAVDILRGKRGQPMIRKKDYSDDVWDRCFN